MWLETVLAAGLTVIAPLRASQDMTEPAAGRMEVQAPTTFADAQRLFYNARYRAAADAALALRASGPHDLANDELRTSALLFQLKALLDTPGRKDVRKAEALKACATCPALIAAFFADIKHGQALARTQLQTRPGDEAALFFLGKLN